MLPADADYVCRFLRSSHYADVTALIFTIISPPLDFSDERAV